MPVPLGHLVATANEDFSDKQRRWFGRPNSSKRPRTDGRGLSESDRSRLDRDPLLPARARQAERSLPHALPRVIVAAVSVHTPSPQPTYSLPSTPLLSASLLAYVQVRQAR